MAWFTSSKRKLEKSEKRRSKNNVKRRKRKEPFQMCSS